MNRQERRRLEERADVIKALAHGTRLYLIEQLTGSERCVCELTEMIGSDMSTVSRHLALLKGAGLIEDEKRGQMVYYRLRMKCILSFFECIESVMACNAKIQREKLAVWATEKLS